MRMRQPGACNVDFLPLMARSMHCPEGACGMVAGLDSGLIISEDDRLPWVLGGGGISSEVQFG